MAPVAVAQLGLPEWLPGLIGIASMLVMLLLLTAIGGIVYKTLTGGIEWPDDEEETEENGVRRGDSDDEWDFY